MPFSLAASALSLGLPKLRRKHPNRMPFRGVLTLLDVPSDHAPSGSKNRRVLMPRAVAEAALPSLVGMALDYTPSLDGHDLRRKIGVITHAEIAPVETGLAPSLVGPPAFRPLAETQLAPSPVGPPVFRPPAETQLASPVGAPGFSPVNNTSATHRIFSPGPLRGARLIVRGHIFARDFPDVVIQLLRSNHASTPSTLNANRQPLPVSGSSIQAAPTGRALAPAAGQHDSPLNAKTRSISAAAANSFGIIRAHVDFPTFGNIAGASAPPPLGMSYELAEALVVNEDAPILVLQDFVFTGAAVLRRDCAAYRNTSIELLTD